MEKATQGRANWRGEGMPAEILVEDVVTSVPAAPYDAVLQLYELGYK
jgi:hypothetical protein